MEERTLERTPAAGRRGLAEWPAAGAGVRELAAGASVPERLAARAYLYALFQRLFAEEPNESFVQAVDAELAREAFVLMGGTACDAEAFGEALAGLEDVPARRIDYARLFVGPGALPAPPWESVWKLKDGSLFTRITLEVRAAYRAQGFIPERYPQVSDDHLALELDFLAQLAQGMQKAWEEGDGEALERVRRASASFLEEHLGAWIGPFSANLASASSDSHAADLANACQGPYATAARLLERLVRLDAAFLSALPSALKGERA